MRMLLILIALWLTTTSASAQIAAKYQVQRGDTYASIARKFGMTEDELRHENPGKRHLYAGMSINIIDYNNGRPRNINIQRDRYDDRVDMEDYETSDRAYGTSSYSLLDDPSFQEAQRLEQMGKYKDAAKIYLTTFEDIKIQWTSFDWSFSPIDLDLISFNNVSAFRDMVMVCSFNRPTHT